MADRAGNQIGLVGAVDADVSAAGSVGEHGGAGAGTEREWAVEGARIARQLLADEVLARRGLASTSGRRRRGCERRSCPSARGSG